MRIPRPGVPVPSARRGEGGSGSGSGGGAFAFIGVALEIYGNMISTAQKQNHWQTQPTLRTLLSPGFRQPRGSPSADSGSPLPVARVVPYLPVIDRPLIYLGSTLAPMLPQPPQPHHPLPPHCYRNLRQSVLSRDLELRLLSGQGPKPVPTPPFLPPPPPPPPLSPRLSLP